VAPSALPTPDGWTWFTETARSRAPSWRTAYERVLAPKRLVTLEGGHFDSYDREFQAASHAAVDWFSQHLASK
jgi:uncharacterized protein